MVKVKAGLIQMSLKTCTSETPEHIREVMIEAHIPFIERAGKEGVQVLCFQELFDLPYFCPSRDVKWCVTAEHIPEGPTTRLMQEYAARYKIVIVVPIYEESITGVYYNSCLVIDADGRYLGKYRKVHIPDVAGFYEKFFFRPGDLGYPIFDTAYVKLGVYICYDRHFPEGWRALALNGAEYIVCPSATVAQMSKHLWQLEQPAAAVANGCYIGAINRLGIEQPWSIGTFYGSSYVVNPCGEIIAQGSDNADDLVIAELDMEMVRKIRNLWQFFRDRRPETYGDLSTP